MSNLAAVETAPITNIQHPVSETAAILQIIERAASNAAVDIEKMSRLFEMRNQVVAEQRQVAFNASMAAAQAEMPLVLKGAKNDQTRSSYATLEAVCRTISPVWTKHGFALSFGTSDCPIKDHYRITCDVTHAEGYSRSYYADIPIDAAGIKGQVNKTATHAFGSTMSYGRRYLTLMIFNIATTDDNDGNRPRQSDPIQNVIGDELIDSEQIMALEKMITEVGADKERFLKFFQVASLTDIALSRYDDAVACLQAKKKGAA